MQGLAVTYGEAGKLDLALPLFEETLKRRKAKLGDDHPDTLTSMEGLSSAYFVARKLDLALPLLEETLKRRKVKLGEDHPDTLTNINNLATVYRAAGKLDLALPLLEETLKRLKAKIGEDDPSTLECMKNLAVAYWHAGKLDKSVPLFEKLVQLYETKLGRDHPNVLNAIGNLGVNYKDSGRVEEALPLLEEAYEGSKKHPRLKWISTPLMDAYLKTGRETEARIAVKIFAEDRKTLPPGSPELAGKLAMFGLGLLEAKAYGQAEPILRECMAIREKTMPEHWLLFNTHSMLGGALLGQEKYAEAEPLLIAGYEGLLQLENSIPPQGKIRLTEAIERLVELYTSLEKPDEVNKWQAELDRRQAKEGASEAVGTAQPESDSPAK